MVVEVWGVLDDAAVDGLPFAPLSQLYLDGHVWSVPYSLVGRRLPQMKTTFIYEGCLFSIENLLIQRFHKIELLLVQTFFGLWSKQSILCLPKPDSIVLVDSAEPLPSRPATAKNVTGKFFMYAFPGCAYK